MAGSVSADRIGHGGKWYWMVWGILGLYMATMDFPYIVWWKAILGNLFQYLCWGTLSLGTLWLSRRYPLFGPGSARGRRGAWFIHGLASIGMTCFALFLTSVCFHFLRTFSLQDWFVHRVTSDYWALLKAYFHYSLFTYWPVGGIRAALDIQARAQAKELLASQLEAKLSAAQLQALRMQIHPHFLFNTLNAATALLRRDVQMAEKVLVRLGELLRLSLEETGSQEVTICHEMAFLEKYLDIESIRFQGRLAFSIEILPPGLAEARVPSFLLQPLVENALKHGLADQEEGGRITVRASEIEGSLCLEVEDNGVGLPSGPIRSGVGTTNSRSRLETMYGDRQRFELVSRPGGGAIARVCLPLMWNEVPL